MKYALACSQVLPAEVPKVTVSREVSLVIPICRGDTLSHHCCNGSVNLQSAFAFRDILAVASLSFPNRSI